MVFFKNFFYINLYLSLFLILIPIQGMLLTWVSGSDVLLLGIIKLPRLIEEDFILHSQYMDVHYAMTITLFTLFLIHLSASMLHIFYYKDKYNVWKSMKFIFKK